MTSFSKILKTIFAFLQSIWQKILHFFFGKKKPNINKPIIIWQLNANISSSNYFSNKNILRNKKIRPFKRKIRGLDIENGGIEESDDKTQKHVKDAWDDRAKNLLKVGQVGPLSSQNKKAMLVWYCKLLKLQTATKVIKNKQKLKIPKESSYNFDISKAKTFTEIVANKKSNNNITR